jgi:hypothetical protein
MPPIDSGLPDTYVGIPDTGIDTWTPPAACPSPVFMPAAGMVPSGQDIVITAPGLAASGYICYTTDGTIPSSMAGLCKQYGAGATGIQITTATDFKAIATDNGKSCSDSPVVDSAYTITMIDTGLPGIPVITAAGGGTTENNAFQVSITDTNSTSLCYTLDGTTPACGTTANTCATGTTLSNGGMVPIGPSNTAGAAMPGMVQVQAVGCDAMGMGGIGKAAFTLQAAAPTMTPPPGASTYSATLTGAFADATLGSTIYYTTDGSMPTCAGGGTTKTYGAPFGLTSGTYYAIACETGFAPSTVAGPFAIAVTLPQPSLSPAAGSFTSQPTVSALNAGSYPPGTWLCYSTSAATSTTSAPACGTNGACMAGSTGPTVSPADQSQVQAIACAPPGYTNSGVATQTPYKLVLATPVVTIDGAAVTTGSYALTTPITGAHGFNFSVPAGATAPNGYCYARNPAASAPPGCGATAGTCTTGATFVAGSPADYPYTATNPAAGDTVSVIACPTSAAFEASTVVSTIFTGAGQAPPPAISVAAGLQNQPVNAVLRNTAGSPQTVCYSNNGTAPTCTPGATTGGCSTLDGSNPTAQLTMSYALTNAGGGYSVAPYVVLTPGVGPGSCTGSPTATIAGGAVTGVTGGTCQGITAPANVLLATPADQGTGLASSTAAVTQNYSFTVSAAGTGYTAATVTVSLAGHLGTAPATCNNIATTSTVANGGVTSIAVSTATLVAANCPLFTDTPTVTVNGGTGAKATMSISGTETVTYTPGANRYYTVAPTIAIAAQAGQGAGGCAGAPAVTITNDATHPGVITAVAFSGCSGFTHSPAAVTVTDAVAPSAVAGAIAYGSNMAPVPTLQVSPTTLDAVACNTGLATSPTASNKYTFQMPAIQIGTTSSPGLSTFANGLAGTWNKGTSTLTLTTIYTGGQPLTPFADTTIVYSLDPTVVPNCAGVGKSLAAPTGSITLDWPAPDQQSVPAHSYTLQAIACGANQPNAAGTLASSSAAFNVATANPVFTNTAGGLTIATTPTVTAYNPVSVAVATPTTNSYVCYSATGVPVCSTAGNGCDTAPTGGAVSKWAFPGGTQNITTSGSSLLAVACTPDQDGTHVDQSALNPGETFDLQVSPANYITSVGMVCPTTANLGFTTAATYAANGGPTVGGTVCYSYTSQPTGCGAAAGVTCFTPSAATPTAGITTPSNSSLPLYVTECMTGFDTTTYQPTLTLNAGAVYAPAVTTTGASLAAAGWGASELVTGSVAGLSGGMSYGPSSAPPSPYNVDFMFLATGGVPAADSVVFYFSDGGTTGTTTAAVGSATLPFKAQFAIEAPAAGGVSAAWHWSGTAWVADTNATGVWGDMTNHAGNAGAYSAGNIYLQVPVGTNCGGNCTFNPTSNTVNVLGQVVTGGGALVSWWPVSGTGQGYIVDGLQTCQVPDSNIQ